MSSVRPQDLVERALALSRTDGCVVIAEESSSTNLRWAGNTLTTNGEMRGRSLTVIAMVDGAEGTASGSLTRSNVSVDELESVVRAAETPARAAEPAEDARPIGAGLLAGRELGRTSPRSRRPRRARCSRRSPLRSVRPSSGPDAEGRELFGFAEHDLATTYLGSTAGVRLRHAQPSGKVEITGKSHARSRSTYVGRATRDFSDIDVPTLEAEVVRRLGWAERSIELAPGRYDTVLPPSAVADLMIYLYWSSAAREAHDGRTVFSRPGGGTRVGDTLSRKPVRLWSDPAHPWLESAPFVVAAASGPASSVFDNGLPLSGTDWIRDGVLSALLQTRASAELTGLVVTPAIDNLLMELPGSAGSTDDLVAATTERTLLLTCLWYIREVDPQTLLLTGLTRDGVHVVEDGEVIGTATNFRFNESPVDLLDRIQAASETQPCLPREWGDFFNRAAMPALRVEGFNMSTVSPAS